MDLAKIRKKSLQTPQIPGDEHPVATVRVPELPVSTPLEISAAPAYAIADSTCGAAFVRDARVEDAEQHLAAVNHTFLAAACSPLEAILSGRTAAGCDDESFLAEESTGEIVVDSSLEFLCFRVSSEIYGINIMDIKEIIKPREVTEVPRAPVFVSGVLSLRGTIIPVIDMRVRLGLPAEEQTGKERIVVIKNIGSFCGLMVDEVTQVVKVPLDAVEAAPAVLEGIDRDFINGLGRSDGHLIIILNLENITDINLY